MIRVLVVDDEENHRKTLAIGLRLEGFEVMEAEDGERALEVLEKERADVAIVDLMMPGLNGLELARKLRFRCADLKVLLTSGYVEDPAHAAVIESGELPFMHKPLEPEGLARRVRAVLDGK